MIGPPISVIIPVHNRAKLILRALASVRAQTYAEFEILVVDDGSTDGLSETLGQLDEPRLRVLRHTLRQGAASARNTGIRASTGEYLAFLDSDDEWMPNKLERQLELTHRHPNIWATTTAST